MRWHSSRTASMANRVWAFGRSSTVGIPSSRAASERAAGAQRPGVDDVDLAGQARQRAGHQPVVQVEGAQASERAVGDSHAATCQRRLNAHPARERPVHGARRGR